MLRYFMAVDRHTIKLNGEDGGNRPTLVLKGDTLRASRQFHRIEGSMTMHYTHAYNREVDPPIVAEYRVWMESDGPLTLYDDTPGAAHPVVHLPADEPLFQS